MNSTTTNFFKVIGTVLLLCYGQNFYAQNTCSEAVSIVGNVASADMSIATNDNNETDFGDEPNYQFCGNGSTIANCETANWHNAYYMTNYNDLWFVANIANGANTFDVDISNFSGNGHLYILPYASNGDCSSLSLMDISNSANSVADGSCPTLSGNGNITFSGDAIATASANPIYLRVIAHENSTSTSATPCSSIEYPTFDITAVAPQANDICADAVDIDRVVVMGNLCSAAIETENSETGASCGEAAANNDLWYAVTMETNQNDQLLQIGLTFENATDAVVVELYHNCFSNTFLECATISSVGAGTTKAHQFESMITAGGFGPTWYVRVRPAAGNGICNFAIQANRVAENNSCEIANEVFPIAFTVTNPVVADFNFATPSNADGQNAVDLWYVFDPVTNADAYGHTTFSTQADVNVSGLNAAEELILMLYKRHGATGDNCTDLAADYLATLNISTNGTSTISCLDEIHGTSGIGDGYLLRVLQTAGNTYATPTITLTPSAIEVPFNNSCENIWDGNSPKSLGSTGIDAAHNYNAYYMLVGETKNGTFVGATDCDSAIASSLCNNIDYEAIAEIDNRDLWYAFEVPSSTCTSDIHLTYNANNAFHDGLLYIYSACGDANLIDCSSSLNGEGETWAVAGLTQGESYLLRVKPWYISSTPTDWAFEITLDTQTPTDCCVPITIDATATDVTCVGNDGAININITGGSGVYTSIAWNNGMTGNSISNLAINDYTVIVIDDLGCTSELTVTIGDICVTTCGETTNLTTDINATDGLTVTLSWDAVINAEAYQLAGRRVGGSVKTFSETQMTSRTFSSGISFNTSYQWSVRVKCDGVWTDYAMPIGEFTTPAGKNNANNYDIFAAENNLSLSLYPNPANQQVTLSLTEAVDFDKIATQKTIQITDMLGRVIHTFETNNTQMTLNTSEFANGSYFVLVSNGSQTVVEKLLLIR